MWAIYWKSKFNIVQLIVIVYEPVWCPAHVLAHNLAHKLIIRVRIPVSTIEKQNLSVFTRKPFGIPKLVCKCYLRWYRVKVMRWFYVGVVRIQDAYLNINHLWYRRMCTLEVGSPKVSRRRGGRRDVRRPLLDLLFFFYKSYLLYSLQKFNSVWPDTMHTTSAKRDRYDWTLQK